MNLAAEANTRSDIKKLYFNVIEPQSSSYFLTNIYLYSVCTPETLSHRYIYILDTVCFRQPGKDKPKHFSHVHFFKSQASTVNYFLPNIFIENFYPRACLKEHIAQKTYTHYCSPHTHTHLCRFPWALPPSPSFFHWIILIWLKPPCSV